MGLYEQISNDIKESMKSKNQKRLDVLRMIKTKIMTVDARGTLPEADIIKIISTYEKSLKDAYEQSKASGRQEALDELDAEMKIVAEFLPQKLSESATRELVQASIKETGAISKKDMGLVMKKIMASGHILDGALVKSLVDELLP